MLENVSTRSYINFEMSSSIIQVTSAFVYLRFSENYKSEITISATKLWHMDFFVALMQLWAPVYLVLHLLIKASDKEWWGLGEKLRAKRLWYPKCHQGLMSCERVINAQEIRVRLIKLENYFN